MKSSGEGGGNVGGNTGNTGAKSLKNLEAETELNKSPYGGGFSPSPQGGLVEVYLDGRTVWLNPLQVVSVEYTDHLAEPGEDPHPEWSEVRMSNGDVHLVQGYADLVASLFVVSR